MFSTQAPLNNNRIEKLDNYEDDFEPESLSEDVSKDETNVKKENIAIDNQSEPPLRVSSPTGSDKDEQKVESPGKDKSHEEASDNDSEMDADAYNFTEDQKRAMMELMVQKQEDSDLLAEDPPEYNVKGRLEQLNAELASEPTPVEGDRELKVGFKSEIVDLVAPPPDFSDDESQPNSARGEPQALGAAPKPKPEPDTAKSYPDAGSGKTDNENDDDDLKNEEKSDKQFVVEREGNFEVLSVEELTVSERAMLMPEEDITEKSDDTDNTKQKSSETPPKNTKDSSTHQSDEVLPKPPTRPRPNTATTGPRRNVRPAQSPRPKSATHSTRSNSSLSYLNYTSPYAMSPEQKEQGREHAKRAEEERKERDRRKQEESRQRHEENEKSFQAWLRAKSDGHKRRDDNSDYEQTQEERYQEDEILKIAEIIGQSGSAFETYDVIYPYLLKSKDLRQENEEAYKTWIKEKRTQGKKEKLLKRRQQQEMMEAYYTRPREEVDKAFKEWLKKKNADLRRQHEMERQRSRLYRMQIKRSKKSQALLKAMRESQAFRYVDYYGYRY